MGVRNIRMIGIPQTPDIIYVRMDSLVCVAKLNTTHFGGTMFPTFH